MVKPKDEVWVLDAFESSEGCLWSSKYFWKSLAAAAQENSWASVCVIKGANIKYQHCSAPPAPQEREREIRGDTLFSIWVMLEKLMQSFPSRNTTAEQEQEREDTWEFQYKQ